MSSRFFKKKMKEMTVRGIVNEGAIPDETHRETNLKKIHNCQLWLDD